MLFSSPETRSTDSTNLHHQRNKTDETASLHRFIQSIPKAELHLHIEGTLEPELMFTIARRNDITIGYNSVDDLRSAYDFRNLQDFLDIYYQGARVLQKERDYYDLTLAYLMKAHSQGVVHTEIMFDPQTHTDRGISFETVINGISNALVKGKDVLGITSRLILCFLRHLDEEAAFHTLEEALQFKELITAVGLDSSEVGHPPSKFLRVFTRARDMGFMTVAHAGEEGPAKYVREVLDLLQVSRIDHGNRSLEQGDLVEELVNRQIPLTLCPLSNLKLRIVKDLRDHPLKEMMDRGLQVTVNSDDPAYFGGYINENYFSITNALELTVEDIGTLARNSFQASFLDIEDKRNWIARIDDYIGHWNTQYNNYD